LGKIAKIAIRIGAREIMRLLQMSIAIVFQNIMLAIFAAIAMHTLIV
jgi:hypothetical protein